MKTVDHMTFRAGVKHRLVSADEHQESNTGLTGLDDRVWHSTLERCAVAGHAIVKSFAASQMAEKSSTVHFVRPDEATEHHASISTEGGEFGY